MSTVEFLIEDGKLKKKNPETIIISGSTDTLFSFELPTGWDNGKFWCLIKTNVTRGKTFRLPLTRTIDKYFVEIPIQLTRENFIKISIYGTLNDRRVVTNELIIPIGSGGYLEYASPSCISHHPSRIKHPPHHARHGGRVWDEYHVDIYEYILTELKTTVNYFEFDTERCYAYHGDKLLQIIPLPNFVTRDELHDFFGDVIKDIELDEETGELYQYSQSFKID